MSAKLRGPGMSFSRSVPQPTRADPFRSTVTSPALPWHAEQRILPRNPRETASGMAAQSLYRLSPNWGFREREVRLCYKLSQANQIRHPVKLGSQRPVKKEEAGVSEVVHLASQVSFGLRRARTRVENMTTLFKALHAGGLLDMAPEDPEAKANHTIARQLLGLMQTELDMLSQELP